MANVATAAPVQQFIDALPPYSRKPKACKFLQCSERKLYNLIADGHIEAVKLQGTLLIRTASCLEYLDSLPPAKIKIDGNRRKGGAE